MLMTVNVMLWVAAAVLLVLYLKRRRTRLNREL
jgi:hypothetical protein